MILLELFDEYSLIRKRGQLHLLLEIDYLFYMNYIPSAGLFLLGREIDAVLWEHLRARRQATASRPRMQTFFLSESTRKFGRFPKNM